MTDAAGPRRWPPEGTPLPTGARVFRLFTSNDGRATSGDFALSTADREAAHPRLSVFETTRTAPMQAWPIAQTRAPAYAGFVDVADVREIRPEPTKPMVTLDVIWETALDDDGRRWELPGADGHCGINGLHTSDGGTTRQRKSLRRKLAHLANRTGVERVRGAR